MANVIHAPIDFHRGPAAPSFGFGFGLSPAARGGWQPLPPIGHQNPAAFQQLASTQLAAAPRQKRRHEPEEEQGEQSVRGAARRRDDAMDRSPTPERPKRGPPKRPRVAQAGEGPGGEKSKEGKAPGAGDEVDVGVLLGESAAGARIMD